MSGILEVYQSGKGISSGFEDNRIDIDPEHQNKRKKKEGEDNNNNSETQDTLNAHQSALDALKQNAQELSQSGSSPPPQPPAHNTFKHFLQQHSHSLGASEPEEHDELWDKVYKEHNFKDKKKKGKGKVTPKSSSKDIPKPNPTGTPVTSGSQTIASTTTTSTTSAVPPPRKKKGKGKGKKKLLKKEVEMDNLSDLEKGELTESARLEMERTERVMDYRTCGCLFVTAFLLCIILFNLPK
eukprot:TRINITY_DN2645_c0_g1_i1.p1 TRINITY_DN2645_c0_g1~~TRINITY_DN2645_c0_g1_i1.p1  ORF type:complete len:240 (+),score=70.37 TRINITY_DN2645_c0_g1_i1:111-830(+)